MALTHKYTLLCDEVRQESNGKYIVLGLYTPDIVVPAIPFVLPTLSFFNVFQSDGGAGQIDFAVRLSVRGNQLVNLNGSAMLLQPGVVVLPLRFGPVQLQADGDYVFVFESPLLDDAVEHRFRVVVNAALAAVGPAH